jgi:ATP-binding cassette subfamily C (CFTR/MRP) protein 1
MNFTLISRRRLAVEAWNAALDDGSYKPSHMKKMWWKTKKSVFRLGTGDGKNHVGLAGALSDTFFYQFWSGGVIKVFGDVAQVTSPLVTKALINFATQSYYAYRGVPGFTMPPVGTGIGLAFGLWAMQVIYALSIAQFFTRAAGVGVSARTALIASIYRKSIVLSGKARVTSTNGKLINHISTDVSRIDFCCGFFHLSWTAFVQIGIIIGLLVANLGVSSLAGVAFLFVALPFQGMAMKSMFALRRKAMIWTDRRAKLMQELLGGMKIIKFFGSFASFYLPYSSLLTTTICTIQLGRFLISQRLTNTEEPK